MKWNFLFMAESLDGGKVGYRSNRQFDILNENMVFRFTQDHVSDPWTFASELENRRSAYGNGLILLNLTCHDEVIPWGDPQCTASRYAMVAAIDGVPMIFYGQEQGISTFDYDSGDDPDDANKWKGFFKFESNFGKWIPHFKTWNAMHVWTNVVYEAGAANDSRAMAEFYGRINLARLKSPALQSRNRWFLGETNRIMCCAKWETAGENPNVQDAVIAAVLFLNDTEDAGGHWGSAWTYDISDFAANLGIENDSDHAYNIVNLASTNAGFVWDSARTGADIYENGIYIGFDGSCTYDSSTGTTNYVSPRDWANRGTVAQYLKIVDVTDYPVPVIGVGVIPTNAAAGDTVAVSVTATGEGLPTIDVTAVSPEGTDYTYAADTLSFVPAAAGTYAFTFLAQNTLNDKTATTNVEITIVSGETGEDVVIAIASVGEVSYADGKISLSVTTTNGFAAGTVVPVYTADTLVGSQWNWTAAGTATVASDGSIALEDVEVGGGTALLLSIGKPTCLDD